MIRLIIDDDSWLSVVATVNYAMTNVSYRTTRVNGLSEFRKRRNRTRKNNSQRVDLIKCDFQRRRPCVDCQNHSD